jgi:hypothetical protein
MTKLTTKVAVAFAAASMLAAAPASATIFEYTFGNGDLLTIDTETQVGTWTGDQIDAKFTSADFATFEGGASPTSMAAIDSIGGTRVINGNVEEVSTSPRHPEKLILDGSRFNLWANWGNPIVRGGGDYVRTTNGFTQIDPGTDVPAPGMLALFGMALAALGLRSRRRKQAASAA